MLNFKIFKNFPEIEIFITTKENWVSEWVYEWLNLALHVWDDEKKVLENRKILSEKFWKNPKDFVYMDQIHWDKVEILNEWKWFFDINSAPKCDWIITNKKDLVLMVLVADCVPVVVFDRKNKVVSVVHAWWKWTEKNILKKTLEKMEKHFWTELKNVLVWIWPSICQKNYEVWKDVFKNFSENFFDKKSEEKALLNLQEINKFQALEKWVLEKNIEIINLCSLENKDLFFSARRDWVMSWRFWIWVYLK